MGRALTIAGSDCGGGAGIQADLKAFSAMGAYGCSVITAVTAQNTCKISAVHPVPEDVVAAQIEAVLSDIKIDAIKIGMLGSPSLIETVARAIGDYEGPVIIDPVMVAKSGAALLEASGIAALKKWLVPRADLLTPNIPEAAALSPQSLADIQDQADALLSLGARAVLLKGGHATGETCTDWLYTQSAAKSFDAPRIKTKNTHGTGCSYSAAIAAVMAQGHDLEKAVAQAHIWLHRAIANADLLQVGHGHGPIHHFHGIWA